MLGITKGSNEEGPRYNALFPDIITCLLLDISLGPMGREGIQIIMAQIC